MFSVLGSLWFQNLGTVDFSKGKNTGIYIGPEIIYGPAASLAPVGTKSRVPFPQLLSRFSKTCTLHIPMGFDKVDNIPFAGKFFFKSSNIYIPIFY